MAIRLAIDDGWHVNSNTPTEEYLIPTSVGLATGSAATLGEVVYPRGETIKLGFSERALSVYEGDVWLEAPLESRQGEGAGRSTAQV